MKPSGAARCAVTQLAAGVLAALLVMALVVDVVGWRENARAERNLEVAREAVDEALSSASTDPATLGADVPEMVAFRRDLMRKAERFYTEFVRQEPNSEAVLSDVAEGHKRLGHIHRIMGDAASAEHHYHTQLASSSAWRPTGRQNRGTGALSQTHTTGSEKPCGRLRARRRRRSRPTTTPSRCSSS